jgi:hypothetical protein
MTDITWTNERRKLSELIPWERNPRQIKRDQAKRLQDSLTEFGQVEPVCIGPGNALYNGHQRLKSWAAEFGDIEIDVRVASRALSEKEREKLTVYLHKGAAGEWDFDALSEWDVPDLIEWGFEPKELGIIDEPLAEEKGEPEELPEQYMILIECKNEMEQAELLARFNDEGLQCRALLS